VSDQYQKLFSDFESISSKQWKQQIQYELKGADYNETVLWDSPEGIRVKPFYHSDEEIPAAGYSKTEPGFLICQDIFVHDIEKSVKRAIDVINRGATALLFIVDSEDTDMVQVLSALPLSGLTIYIRPSFLSATFAAKIEMIAAQQEGRIYLLHDPIGHLAADGNWYNGKDKDNFVTLQSMSAYHHVSCLSIDMGLYQNAGANIVQQLAYGIGQLIEYLNRLTEVKGEIVFQVSVGSNYFFEIAKLRALRQLYTTFADAFGITATCHILATPSKRNKTIYDYNVNMLRTTTECMSAVLGGADSVINMPYDALYHKNNEFGDRIARNQLLILKHEAYFDKTANAADGCYYIESLTEQLASKSLDLVKDIERNGGFLHQLGNGVIRKKISESADAEQSKFDSGQEPLLGTNKYPNPEDKMADDMQLYPFVKTNPRKTLISPIIPKRLAEKSEQDRLTKEKNL
jgi:methylmalonyl-CoA mutase